MGEDDLAYLKTLPFDHRVTPPGGISPEDDLLIVHATPTDVDPVIILEPHPLGITFTSSTPEAEVISLLGTAKANLIVYGHIHYASSSLVQGQRLASVGSVGSPTDGDQRAAYALIAWERSTWRITHRRVSYAYERTAQEVECSGQPMARRYAQMLREARWLPYSAST